MPERNHRADDDDAREHTALPPDPETPYTGADRRKPGLGTELARSLPAAVAAGAVAGHVAAQAQEPEWWRKIPSPWRAFIQMGLLGMFVVLFAVYFWDNRAAIQRAEAERRSRDTEEREIRRAEQAQQDRRNDVLATEIRAIGVKFDGLSAKLDGLLSENRSVSGEIRSASRILDRIGKELQAALDRILKKVPAPAPVSGPDLAPAPDTTLRPFTLGEWPTQAPWRMPELAPPPREVKPCPRVQPCETHRTTSTRTGPPTTGA